MAQRDLRRVATRARQVKNAKVALADAIYWAHVSGESIRDIAPFAGLSPSRVHELLVESQEARQQD